MNLPRTLGELKKSGYRARTVKQELRDNLIARIRSGLPLFADVHGYEDTVVPALQRAILAGHSINLLGLRGQAKTRMARALVDLLDEWVPVVEGSEVNDDPMAPLSRHAREIVARMGDDAPVDWLHRSARYSEKLATPDVTVADLIGDSDPIKAANLKLDYGDERVIHFGLIPRSNRGIFVINELPDLQPRIQVALFNILQEGDVQVRGFKLRLPLDIQFVFTANPEDYTNRGAIITPLKDRIQSQILTHYPPTIELGMRITGQEASVPAGQDERVRVPDLLRVLIERLAMEARDSELVDRKSGVSARLTISAYETLRASAELRTLRNGDGATVARMGDLWSIVPAITGKIELVYEGEQEGPEKVAGHLLGQAVRNVFAELFPDAAKPRKRKADAGADVYASIVDHFSDAHCDLLLDHGEAAHAAVLRSVPGLLQLVAERHPYLDGEEQLLWAEFVLHGLAEHSRIGRSRLVGAVRFGDLMRSVLGGVLDADQEP